MLVAQVLADVHFLSSHNINDYSLLLGIHKLHSKIEAANYKETTLKYLHDTLVDPKARHKPFFEIHEGGLVSEDNNKIFFIGIIDILTEYEYLSTDANRRAVRRRRPSISLRR